MDYYQDSYGQGGDSQGGDRGGFKRGPRRGYGGGGGGGGYGGGGGGYGGGGGGRGYGGGGGGGGRGYGGGGGGGYGGEQRQATPPLMTEKIMADRKQFFLDLKENARGRVVKITEDVNGRRDTIMVPMDCLQDFYEALGRILDYDRGTPQADAPYSQDAPYPSQDSTEQTGY